MSEVKTQAEEIAAANPEAFAMIDPMSIITLIMGLIKGLQTLFASCQQDKEDDTPDVEETQAEFLESHYDEDEDRYSQRLFNRAQAQVFRKAKRSGHRVSQKVAGKQAKAILDHARTASPDVLVAVGAECASEAPSQ